MHNACGRRNAWRSIETSGISIFYRHLVMFSLFVGTRSRLWVVKWMCVCYKLGCKGPTSIHWNWNSEQEDNNGPSMSPPYFELRSPTPPAVQKMRFWPFTKTHSNLCGESVTISTLEELSLDNVSIVWWNVKKIAFFFFYETLKKRKRCFIWTRVNSRNADYIE